MAETTPSRFEAVSKSVQVVSVVIGVVMSILSYNSTQQKEAAARQAEAEARTFEYQKYVTERQDAADRQQIEAAKPFLELRQKRYLEAVQAAAVMSNPGDHTPQEMAQAKKRFRELYVAELSMVEGREVEGAMITLAQAADPQLRQLTPEQQAALDLSHALRNSLLTSWKVDDKLIEK